MKSISTCLILQALTIAIQDKYSFEARTTSIVSQMAPPDVETQYFHFNIQYQDLCYNLVLRTIASSSIQGERISLHPRGVTPEWNNILIPQPPAISRLRQK